MFNIFYICKVGFFLTSVLLEYSGGSQAFWVQILSLGSCVLLGRSRSLSMPRVPRRASRTAPTSKLCWEDAMSNALCNVWHVTNTLYVCYYRYPHCHYCDCFLYYYCLPSQLSSTLRIEGNRKPIFCLLRVFWSSWGFRTHKEKREKQHWNKHILCTKH